MISPDHIYAAILTTNTDPDRCFILPPISGSTFFSSIFLLLLHIIQFMNILKRYTIVGIIFVLIIGTIWHFVYGWTEKNFIIGLFFPINESVWEHMKLCFFPMLLYAPYMERKVRREYPAVVSSLLCGVLLGTFLIPVLFYTYSGILGENLPPLDIATFIVSVLSAFVLVYRSAQSGRFSSSALLLKLAVAAVALCFLLFTYHPPHIGLFTDPSA